MLLQQQIARSESTYPRACAPAQTVNRQAGISNGSEQPQLAPQQPQAALEQARQDRQAIYQRIESAKQQARATRERNIRDRAIREQAQVTREQATIRDQAIRDQAIRDQATRGQQTPASVHQPSPNSRPHNPPSATAAFLDHTSATRISTDTVIARALKAQYPSLELTIVAEHNCQLLAYAAAGHAVATPVADSDAAPASLSWKLYAPPARRLDGGVGALGEQPIFSKYVYRWAGHEFIVYFVDGRDGSASYPQIRNYYVLSPEPHLADRLVMEAGKWSDDLHEEILIFDQGTWQKSKELYASIRDARWENVILDEGMKKAVIEDHLSFFRSRDTYTGLKVPWKRGIIYYGPPGNGKTISIKATMNMLYRQTPEIPTLYVRTLTSWAGPEFSVRQIFAQARRYAPCYLVFEDLDTIVSDSVRSYFLNEVDGLKNNDGIFMVGSTNHLDRLDPGISVSSLSFRCLTASLLFANARNRNARPASTGSTISRTRTWSSVSRTATSGRRSWATTTRSSSPTSCARPSPRSLTSSASLTCKRLLSQPYCLSRVSRTRRAIALLTLRTVRTSGSVSLPTRMMTSMTTTTVMMMMMTTTTAMTWNSISCG